MSTLDLEEDDVEGDAQEIPFSSGGGSDILGSSEILTTVEKYKEIEEFSSEELNHAQDLLKSADLDPSLKSILGACLKRVIEGSGRLDHPLNLIRQEVEYYFSDFFLATSPDDWARRVTDGDSVRIIVVELVSVDQSDKELEKQFSKFGEVIRVRTCQSSGTLIAFVEFVEVDDAIEAK